MQRRVVITGIGIVSSLGEGRAEFFQNLLRQRDCIRKIPEAFERSYRFKSRFYVPFPPLDRAEKEIPTRYHGFLQGVQKIGIVSAKLALEDAGYSIIREARAFRIEELPPCSVCIGVGFIGVEEVFRTYAAHTCTATGQQPQCNGLPQCNRLIIPTMMPNSVSAWISILFQVKGDCFTLNASCASGTYAIGEAYRRIKDGYVSVVLAGGVECLREESGCAMRGFDVLGALTKSEDGNPMPFSNRRSGFLFAEGGGCVMILEELEHARRRSAPIYAEIADYRSDSDAHSILQIEKSGVQIKRILEELKGTRKIDYLNSHGTGTILNDAVEARVIREVFGGSRNQPLINSTKGIIGHTIGASGAIEAAVVAMSIRESKVHGNAITDPLDDLNLATRTMDTPVRYGISTSYGFGGHNAGLLFKRYE